MGQLNPWTTLVWLYWWKYKYATSVQSMMLTVSTQQQQWYGLSAARTRSVSVSFIWSNQLNKKKHTWSTREQEQDKKGTENWRLHFAHKKTNKHTQYKNNYNYAHSKNTEKSTRLSGLSDRLNLDNDEKSTVWGKKFQTFIILSIKKVSSYSNCWNWWKLCYTVNIIFNQCRHSSRRYFKWDSLLNQKKTQPLNVLNH